MIRSRRRRSHESDKKFFRINERIRAPKVLIIDEDGQHLGEMPILKALAITREKGLDLIEVSPKAQPPVCKIINYGQFQYQQSRKLQAQKAQTKKLETKVIRISFKIGRHDLELRQNQAKKFLEKGHKVSIEMILRGRERQHKYRAVDIIKDFINSMGENIKMEQMVKVQGGKISSLISLTK
ncbi:translation initiation factor IF-3 [Patescibacteria group bacterium]|nr:translation initiation factor IF-3 [Patescibacteria group bacterium]